MTHPDSEPDTVSRPGRTLGVIPARLASSRLPRKPLHPILGRPLLAWVWDRVHGMDVFDRVVVAVDDRELLDACAEFGADAMLTDPGHPSGTDRVAEVALRDEFGGFDVVVNVQGDEPLLERDHVQATIDLVREGWDVATCASPITDIAEWRDPSAVKVVRDDQGGAMYFSRAAIPADRDGASGPGTAERGTFLRHVGLYTYRRQALERWVALPEGRLERLERLEQLRPLAAGIRIGVAVVDSAAPGVDTPEDAARMAR
ncbi:MAG TPA: 3-deoxy-manno-octulosonate cytidylyltransferase, partial [Longimicrobiales bacterium]|nr:3-deoxy-manno-octulosonate cytidylyltransferase [Longimicrobiales bacterium]